MKDIKNYERIKGNHYPDDIKKIRKTLIKKFFDKNLVRFLRKHNKQYKNQFVYSTYLKRWAKIKSLKRVVVSLKKSIKTPRNVCGIVNIMVTLKKHYDLPFSENSALIAYDIWLFFDNDIVNYHKIRKDKNIRKFVVVDRVKAFKEQKARGFIHINDFEDYDHKFGYLFSNINSDYVLPIPFYHNKHKDYHLAMYDVYHGQYLYGVENWTRVQLPGKIGMAI